MHITKKGLPLLALLLSMVAVEPATAQGYYGAPYNPYAPGVGMVNYQPQLDQMRSQISTAVSSGRIGQYDGNNLMQGVDLIASQATYGSDPATISTAINIFSQRINTLIGQADASRATLNNGFGLRNRRLGTLQNYWR